MHKCRIRRSNSFFCPPCLLLGAKECGRVRRGGRERNCYLLAVAIDHGNCTIYLAMSLLCTNFPIFSAGGGQRQVLLALFYNLYKTCYSSVYLFFFRKCRFFITFKQFSPTCKLTDVIIK